ncbi:alpha-L-rhamnosidase C-terminal domain-containing protein [Tessaracoccus defluvii]
MVSFNHYAAGAVGEWLYTRVAGIEPTSGGYRTFRVAPLVGGGLTSAEGVVETPYGRASSSWRIDGDGIFSLDVEVPVSTACTVVLPDGSESTVASGRHSFTARIGA